MRDPDGDCIASKDCRGQAVPAGNDPQHCGEGAQCIACPDPGLANEVAACIGTGTCSFVCKWPYGDCNGNPADGCEVDLSTDSSNCGACGVHCQHGCLQGACALRWDGESQVAGLTDGPWWPRSGADLPTWATWDGGTLDVRRGPADGGAPLTIASVPADAGVPAAVEVDTSAVYFTTGAASTGAVYRLALAAPGAVPQQIASGQDGPGGLLLTNAGVYWTNALGGQVMRAPSGGGAPEVVASGLPRPTQLMTDDVRVYWINEGLDGGDGSVMAVPLAGGLATLVSLGDSGGAPAAISVLQTPPPASPLAAFRKYPIWVDRRSRQIWALIADAPEPLLYPSTVPPAWNPRQLFPAAEYFYLFDAAHPGLYGPDHIFIHGGGPGYQPPVSLVQLKQVPASATALSSPWHGFWTDGSAIQQF